MLRFSKMHGLGNDFVMIDAINQSVSLSTDQIRQIADRRFGIGCDQLLLVESAQGNEADFRYRIFNADGGEVEQCGNGARCFARFVRDQGLSSADRIVVETLSGPLELTIESDAQVSVDMGPPIFTPDQIPFRADAEATEYPLELNNETIRISALSMGNPHAVIQVDQIGTAPVERLGPVIESHSRFPNRVNVGFMEVVDRSHIKLRVYERGAGETMACGTGACAAVVAGQRLRLLDQQVRVDLPGGQLMISWAGGETSVWMKGPAEQVYEGQIEL